MTVRRASASAVACVLALSCAAADAPPAPPPSVSVLRPGPPTSSKPVIEAPQPFRCGIDVLEHDGYALLQGKQVGLVTNCTGVDSQGVSTAERLAHAPGVKLVALFSPEHGISGEKGHGEDVPDTIDPATHLPVYSLYGLTKKPTPVTLNAVDVLVFDIQDIGTRFYTYITTMGLCMEAAAQRGIGIVVLDRPNPIRGDIIEGQVLEPWVHHFTAYFRIPVRHGLTAAELARWYNATAGVGADLQVVPMTGWTRGMTWADTGLRFVPPSPNIRTPTEALLYSGIGAFEATNVSVGRGTDTPFEWIGAPWIRGADLAARLNAAPIPGVRIEPVQFTPKTDLYAGQVCSGVRFTVTDPAALRTVDLFVRVAFALRDLHGRDFHPRWDEMLRVTGARDFEYVFKAGKPADNLLGILHHSAQSFETQRAPFLLYDR